MTASYPLFRRVRSFLADQERALRATSLAQSSRGATPELRALYTRHVEEAASATPARAAESTPTVSPAARLRAS